MQIGLSLRRAVLAAVLLSAASLPAAAQLTNTAAPVVVGHFHMSVTSLAEHRKFWVDTLGGTPAKIGSADVVRFPGIVLFFDQRKPSGPNRGTAFDHIGFAVPDVPALTTKIVAAGYALTVGREPVPGKEAAAAQGTQAPYGRFSYRVERTNVVEPRDVWVLDPTDYAALTLVTCYPFTYVGSAPQRFIVRAQIAAGPTPAGSAARP